MPKKHQNRALLTKPASSAPPYLSSKASSSVARNQAPSEPTVNELLRESRRANGNAKRLDVAASTSLHPTLRAVLDIPSPPPPPAARTHIRGPARSRRIPGPPPPQSWLAQSHHAPEDAESAFRQLRWIRARIQQQSSTLPGGHWPGQRSLEHLVLKAIATNWPWHAEYDNTYLSTLPVSTRTVLLSYLAVYDEAHWPNPFPLLFPPESHRSDLDSVTRLDLANSLGSWATTVKKLEKELVVVAEAPDGPHASDVVPESWDQETLQTIPFRHARFANLKHLSLAINLASSAPPPSWASLIGLTTHLSRLSSLSLAHWPTPTYTPNASRGRVKIVDATGVATPQAFGGTDMYSALDANWREAAGILKSLSRNLYCLDWLDLSGCGPWLPALTWVDEHGETGPDWNGSWRNLKTLILAVGWLPGRPPSVEDLEASAASRSSSSIDSSRAIEQLYGGSQAIQHSLTHLAQLRLSNQPRQSPTPPDSSTPDLPWNVEHEREKQYFRRDVERYNAEQSTAKEVANGLRNLRRSVGGRYIEFEFGETLDASYAVN